MFPSLRANNVSAAILGIERVTPLYFLMQGIAAGQAPRNDIINHMYRNDAAGAAQTRKMRIFEGRVLYLYATRRKTQI